MYFQMIRSVINHVIDPHLHKLINKKGTKQTIHINHLLQKHTNKCLHINAKDLSN